MIRLTRILYVFLFLAFPVVECYSFQVTRIKGTVKDSTGIPVANVNVIIISTVTGTYTDNLGNYALDFPSGLKDAEIVFSCVGYRSETRKVIIEGSDITLNIILQSETSRLGEVNVISRSSSRGLNALRLPVKEISLVPTVSGGLESLLKTMPGVSSNNELSTQYSVRGGNFDENLVYVNDNEIYRPFLIRSGQQEGLSFINPDLVASVHFSSGGFPVSYGDKLSSVLDIRYRRPASARGTVSLGLLANTFHMEGVSRDGKFTWLTGVRYKSSRMMLKTLDSKGDYHPVYGDIQSLLSYSTSPKSSLDLLLTWSSNTYNFIPQSRVSTFGSEASAYQLFVLFNGREKDRYSTWNGVLSWEYKATNNQRHKFQVSTFGTAEKENFDIKGYYSLNSLDKISGSENFSDSLMNIGIGSWLSHARNSLIANIRSFIYKGEAAINHADIRWGIGIRNYVISDRIREWTMTDSAGYSVPTSTRGLMTESLILSSNRLVNYTLSSYLESAFPIRLDGWDILLNTGVRGVYNSYTGEFLLSPRLSARVEITDNLSAWLSSGFYSQPPFYREMRYPDGSLNKKIESQKSFHSVIGFRYDFETSGRPFSLTTELYNKILYSIVPYRIDNVRLTYSGLNEASGFSRGIDIRLNGEFVPDTESWISISLMDSKLEIPGLIDGKFPAPSDQTVSIDLFFQDYLPGSPTLRAHLNIAFTTGIPIISPFNNRYDQYHRLPPYRRVDLGLTKVIRSMSGDTGRSGFLGPLREIIAGIEIFNLLDINNTISYQWVRTVNNLSGSSRQYAIPNYLTGRSLNFKLSASF